MGQIPSDYSATFVAKGSEQVDSNLSVNSPARASDDEHSLRGIAKRMREGNFPI